MFTFLSTQECLLTPISMRVKQLRRNRKEVIPQPLPRQASHSLGHFNQITSHPVHLVAVHNLVDGDRASIAHARDRTAPHLEETHESHTSDKVCECGFPITVSCPERRLLRPGRSIW